MDDDEYFCLRVEFEFIWLWGMIVIIIMALSLVFAVSNEFWSIGCEDDELDEEDDDDVDEDEDAEHTDGNIPVVWVNFLVFDDLFFQIDFFFLAAMQDE